jgi:hypothetical protein
MNPPRQSVLILIVADLSPRSSRYSQVQAKILPLVDRYMIAPYQGKIEKRFGFGRRLAPFRNRLPIVRHGLGRNGQANGHDED